LSMGLANDELNEQGQARWAELVESASPACKEIASTYAERTFLMQQCEKAKANWRGCSGKEEVSCRLIKISPNFCEGLFPALRDLEPVTMTDYMLCERIEMQRQLQEMQGQLEKLQPLIDPVELEPFSVPPSFRW